MSHLVELDARRRVALGRLGNPAHTRYLVTEHPDGTLTLRRARGVNPSASPSPALCSISCSGSEKSTIPTQTLRPLRP